MRTQPWLWIILALTVIHRSLLAWATYSLSIDSATTGTMALRILAGDRPLFLDGFHYCGAPLLYLQAASFRLLGVSLPALLLPTVLITVGWVAVTYLLVRDLFNRRAGLAAALCIAVPDWISTYYSMAPDCSYNPLFPLGTLALWLGVRCLLYPTTPWRYAGQVVALGAVAGVALWVQPFAAVYLLPAAALLGAATWRRRHAVSTWAGFLPGGLLFLAGLLPYAQGPAGVAPGGAIASWHLHPLLLAHNGKVLFARLLPDMITWSATGLPDRPVVLGFSLAGATLYLLRLLFARGRRDRLLVATPLLFIGCFLLFYLPHELATHQAPRYLIPAFTVLTIAAIALPIGSHHRWLRGLGLGLLAAWFSYNAVGAARFSANRLDQTRTSRAQFARVAHTAHQLGLRHVTVTGDYISNIPSQVLTFYTTNQVRFVYAGPERYPPGAQGADADDRQAFAVGADQSRALFGALDALQCTYLVEEDAWLPIVHDLATSLSPQRSIDPDRMRMVMENPLTGTGDDLLDRVQQTGVSGRADGTTRLHIDLGKPTRISGLLLTPRNPHLGFLPAGYVLRGSLDGKTDTVLQEVEQAYPFHYTAGPSVYLQGGYGGLECRFAPVTVRYLMFTATRGADDRNFWQAVECHVFEALPGDPGDPYADQPAIQQRLADARTRFLAADRWLSARLFGSSAEPAVFSRYNDHLRWAGARISREERTFLPGHGSALAVRRALADETEIVLRTAYGEALVYTREDLSHYSLFRFTGDLPPGTAPLAWNGFHPLHAHPTP